MWLLFLFKQKTAYELRISDWSSDVCSSDLSYLHTCDKAADSGDDSLATIAAGLRAVLDGTRAEFETEYPCPAPAGPAWYWMRVSRFGVSGPVRLIVVPDDISGRKLAEEGLQEKNRLLEPAEQISRTGQWRDARKGKPTP